MCGLTNVEKTCCHFEINVDFWRDYIEWECYVVGNSTKRNATSNTKTIKTKNQVSLPDREMIKGVCTMPTCKDYVQIDSIVAPSRHYCLKMSDILSSGRLIPTNFGRSTPATLVLLSGTRIETLRVQRICVNCKYG